MSHGTCAWMAFCLDEQELAPHLPLIEAAIIVQADAIARCKALGIASHMNGPICKCLHPRSAEAPLVPLQISRYQSELLLDHHEVYAGA